VGRLGPRRLPAPGGACIEEARLCAGSSQATLADEIMRKINMI